MELGVIPTGLDKLRLHSLIYVSVMNFDHSNMPFTDEVQSILETARAFNPTVNVTGALMAGDDRFAQVLEGPLHVLRALYGHIALDRRHRQVLLLSCEPIERREFPEWAMAFVRGDSPAAIPLSSRFWGADAGDLSASAGKLLEMLKYIVRSDPPGQET